MGITYPQYLVLLILWEQDGVAITDITQRLYLDTNTITPLVRRMEAMGLVQRQRSREDERKVLVTLTEKGHRLKAEAVSIPLDVVDCLLSAEMPLDALLNVRDSLQGLINALSIKRKF